jgi:hypothetical protein
MSHPQDPLTQPSGSRRGIPSSGPMLLCGALGLGLGLLFGWFETQGIVATATRVSPKDPLDGLSFIFYGFGVLGAGAGALLGVLLIALRRRP